MPVTYLTIAWAILAVISVIGLYFFNQGKNIITFLTSRRFLISFIVASILGMRQNHEIAITILLLTIIWMLYQYTLIVEKHKRLKY